MSEPYLGEIKMFAGNFAPRGWALCDGQLLAIAQNDALFSLFGTIYGGDGRTTFGIPELRGRLPMHMGNGPGLSPRQIGQKMGSENVTVSASQIPSHNHNMRVSSAAGTQNIPSGGFLASSPGVRLFRPTPPVGIALATNSIGSSPVPDPSGIQAHTNVMPFLCVNFIVALVGIYPSRN
jgi:microcystin-dependent protein